MGKKKKKALLIYYLRSGGIRSHRRRCVFITAVPILKLFGIVKVIRCEADGINRSFDDADVPGVRVHCFLFLKKKPNPNSPSNEPEWREEKVREETLYSRIA